MSETTTATRVHLTAEERAARGKAARATAPRASHAEFGPASERTDPVALLEGQSAARVPELVPIRHERMSVSPFAFYRGSAAMMASDLANTPSTDLRVQLCGDAHLANFGGFQSPERDWCSTSTTSTRRFLGLSSGT